MSVVLNTIIKSYVEVRLVGEIHQQLISDLLC